MKIKKIIAPLLIASPITSSVITIAAFYLKKETPVKPKEIRINKWTNTTQDSTIPDITKNDVYDLIRIKNNQPFINDYLIANLIKRVIEKTAPTLDIKVSYTIIDNQRAKILFSISDIKKSVLITLKY